VPDVEKRDYYEVLQVERRADAVTIKTAYRRLALKFHPDKNLGDEAAAELFKEASEAYQVLSDSTKRALYDQHGHAGLDGGIGFTNVSDIFGAFSDLFGAFFGGSADGGMRRGSSLRAEILVPFDELVEGAHKSLSVRRRVSCETCTGSGSADGKPPVRCGACGGQGFVVSSEGFFSMRRGCPRCRGEGSTVENPCRSCQGEGLVMGRREIELTIPPGVFDGVTMRVPGEGEPAPRGGVPGDLNVRVRVEEHPVFLRSPDDPADLFIQVPVPISTALLGGEVEIHLAGRGRGHATGPDGARARRGTAALPGPRPRPPVRARALRRAAASRPQAEEGHRVPARTRDRRARSRAPKVQRPAEAAPPAARQGAPR